MATRTPTVGNVADAVCEWLGYEQNGLRNDLDEFFELELTDDGVQYSNDLLTERQATAFVVSVFDRETAGAILENSPRAELGSGTLCVIARMKDQFVF